MRTDCTIDDKRVVCPITPTGGSSKFEAGPGDVIFYRESVFHTRTARVLGRVNAPAIPHDQYPAEKVKDALCVMSLSDCMTFAYERWVKPEDVIEVRTGSASLPAWLAWFFLPGLPYSAEAMRCLADYGTMNERFFEESEKHVREWEASGRIKKRPPRRDPRSDRATDAEKVVALREIVERVASGVPDDQGRCVFCGRADVVEETHKATCLITAARAALGV